MKMLSSEVRVLLDKLYNLRGEDSVILSKMNKERDDALETTKRTKDEKESLLKKIENLTKEEQTLQEEGDKLSNLLSGINKHDFDTVLERLNIDFDPEALTKKLNELLPETIKRIATDNESASVELDNVEKEMNDAITKVEELGIRKEEALNNQAKLNEFFELALDGNINITRDEITNLLEKFNFSEDEQREAAKILMFPEDALYEYDATKKSTDKSGKTITEVLVEAKNHEENKVIDEPSKLENIFEDTINSVNVEEVKEETPIIANEESNLLFKEEKNEKEKLIDLLNQEGVNANALSNTSLLKILENYDEEVIKNNIKALKKYDISLNIIDGNPQVLTDKELDEKLNKLINIGKEARDISLSPKVLLKYDLKGLNNTINVLQISGLDPKKVPLIAY
ncbi:hypothetical protein EGR52_09530 [bacterium]|nr:hypothetical protein [bacterium]